MTGGRRKGLNEWVAQPDGFGLSLQGADGGKKPVCGLARCPERLQEEQRIGHVLVGQQVAQFSGPVEQLGAIDPAHFFSA